MTESGLSVVIVAQSPAGSLSACVESYVKERAQTIVVAARSVPDEALNEISESATVIRADAESFPQLAAVGLAATSHDFVAFTEWHCIPREGWASAMREAFAAHAADAVGGSVELKEGMSVPDRALYFVDYGAFNPRAQARISTILPGVNVAFRRSALSKLKGQPEGGFWKSWASFELAAAGGSLVFDPAPEVTYQRHLTFSQLTARRWIHGRCFGAMRRRKMGVPAKLAYAFGAPVLPFVLASRTLRDAGSVPLGLAATIFWTHAAWIAGEWIGHLFGAGSSCRHL